MEPEPIKACLDTHAALWSLAGDSGLGGGARKLISSASRTELVISDIVLLEVSGLSAEGRVQDADGLEFLLAKIANSFWGIPIDPDIAGLTPSLELPHLRSV